MTDTLVDYQNETHHEIVLDREHLVALVNLSSVNRLVMVNLSMVSNKFSVIQFPCSGSKYWHGYVAWQHQQFLVSNNPWTLTWIGKFDTMTLLNQSIIAPRR
ncbi:MAG: hypothetical protein Ct9H90mP16_12410 [Candidatus Poseidoniales archaeon]|nr:MAG: hypothetical protein Ct9H90mP16_12410 [Candidatus Poseidoniales archaeon]